MYEYAEPLIPWQSGRMLTDEDVRVAESRRLQQFYLRAELASLESALVIPAEVIFRIWDYQAGGFRRVRNQRGELVLGAYAVTDELAQELGLGSAEALKESVYEQVKIYGRIREIRKELQCADLQYSVRVPVMKDLPF